MLPIQSELGWSRGSISFAVSLGLVMFGPARPIMGRPVSTGPSVMLADVPAVLPPAHVDAVAVREQLLDAKVEVTEAGLHVADVRGVVERAAPNGRRVLGCDLMREYHVGHELRRTLGNSARSDHLEEVADDRGGIGHGAKPPPARSRQTRGPVPGRSVMPRVRRDAPDRRLPTR